MTKIIVHIYVKNLLKVLKLLKTRKRTRNGFSRIPLRSIRQGAKAPFKTKEQGMDGSSKHCKSLRNPSKRL
jgi:hypothetical protein